MITGRQPHHERIHRRANRLDVDSGADLPGAICPQGERVFEAALDSAFGRLNRHVEGRGSRLVRFGWSGEVPVVKDGHELAAALAPRIVQKVTLTDVAVCSEL